MFIIIFLKYVGTVYNVQIQFLAQIQLRHCMCSYPYD